MLQQTVPGPGEGTRLHRARKSLLRVGTIQQGRGLPQWSVFWAWGCSEEHWQVFCTKNVLWSNRYGKCWVKERLTGLVPRAFAVLELLCVSKGTAVFCFPNALDPKALPPTCIRHHLTVRPHLRVISVPGGRGKENGCPKHLT